MNIKTIFRRRPARVGFFIVVVFAVALLSGHAGAQQATEPVYPASAFNIQLDREVDPEQLDLEALKNQPIHLAKIDGVYTRPQDGLKTIETSLASLSTDTTDQYDVTALRAIIDDLLVYLNEKEELVCVVFAKSRHTPRNIHCLKLRVERDISSPG